MSDEKILMELKECVEYGDSEILSRTIECGELKLLQLRDILMQNGTIMKENIQDNIYVMKTKRGLFGKIIYLSMQLKNKKVKFCGFVYKGNNKDVDKLIDEIEKIIRGKIK